MAECGASDVQKRKNSKNARKLWTSQLLLTLLSFSWKRRLGPGLSGFYDYLSLSRYHEITQVSWCQLVVFAESGALLCESQKFKKVWGKLQGGGGGGPVGVSPAEVLCEHKTSVNKGGVHSFNLNTVQMKKAPQPQRHDESLRDGGSTVESNYISLQGDKWWSSAQ